MKLDSTTLAALLTGTVVTTLLLAAQPSGNPMEQVAWILIGVALSLLTRAYGSHVSTHDAMGGRRYLKGFLRSLADGWPVVVASLPIVAVLLLAAAFEWEDDREHADGSVSPGYTTVALNINVVLLFIWGVVAARLAALSRGWMIVIGLLNAVLGWLIVVVNLATL